MSKNGIESFKKIIKEKDDKIARLENDLELARLGNYELRVKTGKLVQECEDKIAILNNSIKELDEIKQEYKNKISELNELNKKQKDELTSFTKKFMIHPVIRKIHMK